MGRAKAECLPPELSEANDAGGGLMSGARDRSRTGTSFRKADFKSEASTIPPPGHPRVGFYQRGRGRIEPESRDFPLGRASAGQVSADCTRARMERDRLGGGFPANRVGSDTRFVLEAGGRREGLPSERLE